MEQKNKALISFLQWKKIQGIVIVLTLIGCSIAQLHLYYCIATHHTTPTLTQVDTPAQKITFSNDNVQGLKTILDMILETLPPQVKLTECIYTPSSTTLKLQTKNHTQLLDFVTDLQTNKGYHITLHETRSSTDNTTEATITIAPRKSS